MVKEILIIKLSSIGDVALSTVVLEPLKEIFPESRITWVVEPCCKDVIDGNRFVDRVIVWEKAEWMGLLKNISVLRLWREIRRFLRQLRDTGYDMAIDLQGLLKSGVLTALSRAERKVGLGTREGAHIFMSETFRPEEDKRIAGEYKQFMERFFNFKGPLRMHIDLKEEAVLKRDETLRHMGWKDYIAFCPFSSRPQKNWPLERWATLADAIDREFSLPVVVLGGKSDIKRAREIVTLSAQGICNMVGRLDLAESMAFVGGAKAVVGVDTGLTHIGAGLGRCTVVLFGSTSPYLDPDGYRMEIIYKALPCSPCKRDPRCNNDYTCMKAITPEDVIHALRKLLR